MQKAVLVYYLLLVYSFVALAQNKPNGMPGRARRRIIYRRLRKIPLRNHSLNKQSQIRPPISSTPLMSIPLPNIDGDITGVFNSLTQLDVQESSYNILPGKEGRCFANGMIMFDKAVWSPKHCVTCLCSKGEVFCDETSCNPLTCHKSTKPEGECCPVCLENVLTTISQSDTAEVSGDSPVPTNPSEPVLHYMQTQDPMQKKEGTLEKNIHIKKTGKKKKRIKSHKPRRKHAHINDQREEEVETRSEEEKRRVYEEEELRIGKEIKKQEQEQEENEQEKEESEEEEDILRGDVFRMPPHFPIPEPSTEIPPLPTGCSVLENTVSCINAKLTHIPIIRDEELTSIELDGNDITEIPDGAFNGIPNLERIDLRKNKITSSGIGPQAFKNLKNLQRLYMDGNTLVSIPHGLPSSLEELKINENEIHVINEDSFQGLKKLLILELESNKLSEANVSPLAFQPLKSLSYLRLGRNQFRTIPQGLPHSIEELYLDNNQIEEISEICFNHTKNLNIIVLRHNKLEESRIAPLAWINHDPTSILSNAESVAELQISRFLRHEIINQSPPLGRIPVFLTASSMNLESIDLSYNKLYQVPSYLPKSLVHLVLIGNQIDRIPGFVFGHMKPGLEYLYLSFNKLDDNGIDLVSFYGAYHSLREMFLDHNQLKSVPFGIAELKTLNFLRLNNNKIRAIHPERICRSRLNIEEENDDSDEEEDYEDSQLEHLHLEHNFINTRNLSPYTFSCVRSYSSVILKPQNVK